MELFWTNHSSSLMFVTGFQMFFCTTLYKRGFPSGSAVKNPPAVQEMQIGSLGQEDPLEEGMETHSSICAWEIPWTEEPGGLQCMGVAKESGVA